MNLVLLATLLGMSAIALVYLDELRAVFGRLAVAPASAGVAAAVPAATAAPAAGTAPPAPTPMIGSLVRDLRSPDPRRHARAFERLPQFPPGQLTEQLVPMLRGEPNEMKDKIADLLLRCGGEDVLEPLHRYFLGREEAFEAAAGRSPPPSPSAVIPLPTSARRALEPGAPVGKLVPFHAGRRGRRAMMRTEIDETAKAFPAEVLSPDGALRARAMADLPGTGHPHAGQLLVAALRGDPDPLVRSATASALARLPVRDESIEALAEAARDDADGAVRWNACYALGRLGDRRAKRTLRRAENDPDGAVRLAARQALEALGLDPPLPGTAET